MEITKQQKDYDSYKMLMKVYPFLMLAGAIALAFIPSIQYKSMPLGFIVLFIVAFLIDSSLASRFYPFLQFRQGLNI